VKGILLQIVVERRIAAIEALGFVGFFQASNETAVI
jgi:hypothetical protein